MLIDERVSRITEKAQNDEQPTIFLTAEDFLKYMAPIMSSTTPTLDTNLNQQQ
jgi:hypothetical protein